MCVPILGGVVYTQSTAFSSEVIEMNRRAAEHQAQSLLKELEEEIRELRRRSATLTQLVLSEDYLHFLKVPTEVVLPLRQHTHT